MPGGLVCTPRVPLEECHALGFGGGDLRSSVFLLAHIPLKGSPERERTGGEKILRGKPPLCRPRSPTRVAALPQGEEASRGGSPSPENFLDREPLAFQ